MKNMGSIATSGTTDDILLSSSIFLAGMESGGMLDFTIRSIIGGFVWFGIRMLIDRYNAKQREVRETKNKATCEECGKEIKK